MSGGGVEVDCVPLLDVVSLRAVMDGEISRQNVEELTTEVLVRAGLKTGTRWEELGEVGVELAIWD